LTRVLLFSHTTGSQKRACNDAAERLDVELMFATDRCHRLDDPWQDRAVAVRFHDVAASVAAIADGVRARPVDGVIAVGDRPVVLAAHAAQALGLPWHCPEGARASTDKRLSRAALAAAGLPAPSFVVMDAATPDAGGGTRDAGRGLRLPFPFPMVLKAVGLSGSRGVIRANDEQEFGEAFARIQRLLARPQIRSARAGLEDQVLVETFIEGREFALEGVMTQGTLTTFAIFDKPDPLDGPFFEETIYVTPSRAGEREQAAMREAVGHAARALGLLHGPVHAECRVGGDGVVYVLEVAGRPIGGLCGRVLSFTGPAGTASLEQVLLEHAVGRPIDAWTREPAGAAVMMVPIPGAGRLKGVDGHEDARRVPGVFDVRVTAKPDQVLEPLPEAGSYLGFIFARSADPAGAEAAVRAAHQRLHFTIAPEISVHAE
jgi:biotin carboxylase